MKEKTKTLLRHLFGSFVSNKTAVEAAKTQPSWLAFIMCFFGVALPILPIMSAGVKTYGSQYLSNYSYGLEKTITHATIELKDTYEFVIQDDNTLKAYNPSTDEAYNPSTVEDIEPIYTYINSVTGQYELTVYWTTREFSNKDSSVPTVVSLTSYLDGRKYVCGGTTVYDSTLYSADQPNVYIPSYIIIYPNGIYNRLYQFNSDTSVGNNTYGTFKNFESGYKLLENASQCSEFENNPKVLGYQNAVLKNWKSIFDKIYQSKKTGNVWAQIGIYFGIYVGLSLFMSLMIFLLTRGKNNMFNYLKWYTCFKVSSWASVCPGLLAMILGFIFSSSNYSTMFFIMLLGMRIMWLTMKEFRPQTY